MDHVSTTQSLPSTPKSKRQLVEALVYVLLGLLALAFVLLQTNANKQYAAELTEKLEGKSFVLHRWASSGSGMLYTKNNIVMLLEDGVAIRVYLDSVKDIYAGEEIENTTGNELQETDTHSEEGAEWSVHVSIFNRITVKVGETRFLLLLDEFGNPTYLQDGVNDLYRISHSAK